MGQIMTHLWNKPSWPSFNWSSSELLDPLTQARFSQGRVLALKNPFVHSGEISDQKQSLYEDLLVPAPLSKERLNGWQASLFPTGYSGVKKIKIGQWRTTDRLSAGTRNAYAVEAESIEANFSLFMSWWQETPVDLDPLIRSALTFFWFISLSPFEDGNYTLACSLAELALQESEKSTTRLYDISLQLEENRSLTIEKLTKAQVGDGDLTEWIIFFLELHRQATLSAFAIAEQDNNESAFWKSISQFDLNSRQRQFLKQLYDSKINSITNREYVEMTNTSRESAKRDLKELVSLGLLKQPSGRGRSVKYFIEN
jgi:Fic family protein